MLSENSLTEEIGLIILGGEFKNLWLEDKGDIFAMSCR